MRRAYKFRAYPTRPQQGRAVRLLRDHCDLYNAALTERREAWRMRRVSISYGDQSAQLREIRQADPEGQGRHSFTAQQQTLRRLNVTFQAYFKRVKRVHNADKARQHRSRAPRKGDRGEAGEQPTQPTQGTQGKVGYPRFKPYQRFDQVLFVAGDGAKWEPADGGHGGHGGRWGHASLQAVGRLKVHQHRAIAGRVKTLQLKREYRRWYVIVVADDPPQPLPATGRAVGVDVGVARFLTTSDGEVVANPRFLDLAQATIADLQRRKAHAKPGSGNQQRLRRALAKQWRKVRNQRRDFHHKTARALIGSCEVIAVEQLHLQAMTTSASGTIQLPGRKVAQKAGLNRSILDAGWNQFACILTAKAESAGRRVVFVDPAYTSIDCHACGARCVRPRQDTVVCPIHGELDADRNAARNIATRAGLGSGQAAVA